MSTPVTFHHIAFNIPHGDLWKSTIKSTTVREKTTKKKAPLLQLHLDRVEFTRLLSDHVINVDV